MDKNVESQLFSIYRNSCRGTGSDGCPGLDSPSIFPYCSRTHTATDNKAEKKEKLHQQHVQQQRWEHHQQHWEQEEDAGRQPESVQSGTCKSRFPFRPEILPLPVFQVQGPRFKSLLVVIHPGQAGMGEGRQDWVWDGREEV